MLKLLLFEGEQKHTVFVFVPLNKNELTFSAKRADTQLYPWGLNLT